MSIFDDIGGDIGGAMGWTMGGIPGAIGGWFGGDAVGNALGGGNPSVMSNPTYGPGGLLQGGTVNVQGNSIPVTNPGSVDPNQANPYASQYLNNLSGLYGQFSNSAAGSAFNPGFYNQLQNTQQNNLTTSLGNQYAAMGLSGSSAEMGGLNQAIQSNQMNWMNRQQSDQMKSLQGLEGLNSAGYNETMGIQGGYGNFESTYGQDVLGGLGMLQGQQIANTSALGGMFGSGLGALGTYAGATAMAGAFA